MKKTLLIVLLALSINSFAQSTLRISTSIEKIIGRSEYAGKSDSYTYSELKFGQTINQQTQNPQEFIQIIDSAYHWLWDTLSTGWKLNSRLTNMVYNGHNNLMSYTGQVRSGGAEWVNFYQRINTYDDRNNLTNFVYQDWNGSSWVNSQQNTFTFDANNNQTNILIQDWIGGVWINEIQYINTYDGNNNRTNYLRQVWNGVIWVNHWQYIYSYDANNNQTSQLHQDWKVSAWENSSQITLVYDANNNQIGELYQNWDGNAWVNSEQYAYNYDGQNNQTSWKQQHWTGTSWEDSWQTIYTYDASNNRTSGLLQSRNGSIWENVYQNLYTYDANNNQTSELDQNWRNGVWVNSLQILESFDANNFAKGQSFKFWNIAGTKIASGDSTNNFFHTVLGITDLIAKRGPINVFPNPSSDKITIETPTKGSLFFHNTDGQTILQRETTDPYTNIDISGFKSGVYFVRMIVKKKVMTGKFIKN